MDKLQACSIFSVILVCIPILCYAQYQIPNVKFEAFTPRGLRVSIPAEKGVELFAFHGKINKPILQIQPGDISQDVTKPVNGRFTYVDTNLKLNLKDVIHYWVFVQHDQLGFRKDEQSWTVDKLLPLEQLHKDPGSCSSPGVTKVQGRDMVCLGDEIINYTFSEKPIDSNIWTIQKYIPGDPDWPFNIYMNTPDVIDIENGVLRIKPKLEEGNARKDLDLRPGCTGKESECIRTYLSILNPPIVSGQLKSKLAFSFGNVTLKAKLPIGDYIFPELYLQDVSAPQRRILIAYARGNRDYIGKNQIDVGGKKLFGGPYTDVREPTKSKYLSSQDNAKHTGEEWHTFNLLWKPDELDLFIDGTHFGHHGPDTLRATGFNKEIMVHLVLGVGAGGAFEFPDGYTSSGHIKPYGSWGRRAIKDFLHNKTMWIDTWTEASQLQVEYVRLTAV